MAKANAQALLQKSAGEFLQECSFANSRKHALERECARHQQGIHEATDTISKRTTEICESRQNCTSYMQETEELTKRWQDFQSCMTGYRSRIEKSQKQFLNVVTQVDDVAPHIEAGKEALKQDAELYKLTQEVQGLEQQVKAKLVQSSTAAYASLVEHCVALAVSNITSDDAIGKGLATAEENKTQCEAACENAKQRNRTVNLELRTLEMEEAALQQQVAKYADARSQLGEEGSSMKAELTKHEEALRLKAADLAEVKADLQVIDSKVAKKQVTMADDVARDSASHADLEKQIEAVKLETSELAADRHLVQYEKDHTQIVAMDKEIKELVIEAIVQRTANLRLAGVKQALTSKHAEMEHQHIVLKEEMELRQRQELESQLKGKEEIQKRVLELHKRQRTKHHYVEDNARRVLASEEAEAWSKIASYAAKEESRVAVLATEKDQEHVIKEHDKNEKEREKEKERSRSKELQRSLSRNKPQKRRHISFPDSGRTPLKARKFNDMFKENSERSAPSETSSLWYDAKGRERRALKHPSQTRSQTRAETPGTKLDL